MHIQLVGGSAPPSPPCLLPGPSCPCPSCRHAASSLHPSISLFLGSIAGLLHCLSLLARFTGRIGACPQLCTNMRVTCSRNDCSQLLLLPMATAATTVGAGAHG